MNTHAPDFEPPVRRIDRILAYTAVALVAIAIVCFIAIIAWTAMGNTFDSPIWVVASALTMYGLPLGIVAFFALLIMNMVRRSRAATAARGGRKR